MALYTHTSAQTLPLGAQPDDLTSWSEPAVCDRLCGFYFALFSDADRARQAARLHWSCWRCCLGQSSPPVLASPQGQANARGQAGARRPFDPKGEAARRALARMLAEARFDVALIDRADEVVVDEMTDLVLHKYRRAPQQAKSYIDRLVAAAMQMARARAA